MVDETCRICFKKQDAVFSLFRKRKGISPSEKLNLIGVKADVNDTGPSCICCDCLTELETTVSFLEKCEKSSQILAEHLGDGLQENECRVSREEREEVKSGEEVVVEEEHCEECGSRRRCRHWTPPATHTCPKCQRVFTRKFNFKLHLARHSRTHTWWCATCGAGAVSRYLAARHCGPRVPRPCPVPGCGREYTSHANLAVHLRTHSGEKPFECNDCGKKFASKNTLRNHIRIHTGALPYICPICGKQFRTNKLSAHMAIHAGTRFCCTRAGCGKRFKSRDSLRRHVRAHPGGAGGGGTRVLPPHACVHCNARYKHKQSLNKHMRKQHAQVPIPAAQMESDDNNVAEDTESDLE